MATAVASAMKEAQSFWEKAISSSPSKGSSGRGSEGERYGSEDNHDEAAMKIQQEQRARLHCVSLLLDWNGLEIDGVSERPAVNAVDDQGNTALHYAAAQQSRDARLLCEELRPPGGGRAPGAGGGGAGGAGREGGNA